MKTNNKCAAARLEKSRLLAALAVLAVAFVALAAIPAVADDSDAAETPVTEVGTVTELADALAKGGNIKLTSNIQTTEVLNVAKTTTIDLNGFDITGSNRVFIVTGDLTLDGKGTITSSEKITYTSSVIRVGSNEESDASLSPSITVGKDVIINAQYSHGLGLFGTNTKITANIYGTIISTMKIKVGENDYVGIAVVNAGNDGYCPTEINVFDGAKIESNGAGIYHPGRGVVNILGGTVIGDGSGIGIKSGTLNISGGSIICNGANGMPTSGYSNGMNTSGAAIQIESNKGYYGNPDNTSKGKTANDAVKIAITGGSVESKNAVAIYEYLDKDTTRSSVGSITINGASVKSASETDMMVSEACANSTAIAINGGTFSKALDYKYGVTVAVAENSKLNADVVFSAKSQQMTIAKNGSFTGTVSFTESEKTSSAVVNVTAGTEGMTFKAGSIDFSGAVKEVVGNRIIVKSGTAKVSGDTSIPKGMTLTIDENATLTIEDNKTLTIDEGASIVVSGKVTTSSGKIENNGTIQLINEKAQIPSTIGGTGSVDTSAIASEGTISGDWNTVTTYTSNQTITLTGDTVLKSGSQIVVMGKLIIPEGVTLTIEDGAQLVIFSSTGILENNGTIDVQSNAGSVTTATWNQSALTGKANTGGLVNIDAEIVNNGTIDLNYSLPSDAGEDQKYATNPQFNNSGKLTNNGQINVGSESFLYIWENMVNSADASIAVNGLIMHDGTDKKLISNAGSMVFNGEVRENGMSISLISADATVEFVSLSSLVAQNIVKISNGIEKKSGSTSAIAAGSEANIEITVPKDVSIKGLIVTAALEKNAEDDKKYDRYMVAEGSASRGYTSDVDSKEPVSIKVSGKMKVDSELALGAAINMSVAGELYVNGTMASVAGTLDSSPTTYGHVTIVTNGKIIVSGKLTASKEVTKVGMNAAHYVVSATTTTAASYVYTTLDQAVADGAKKIEIYGESKVASNVDVPSGTTVTLKESGSDLKIAEDTKVSFVSGAVLSNAQTIDVKGTLYIEAVKTGLKGAGTITSEVIIKGETDRTYTTLANAISLAAAGSTIELSGDVDIKSDVTIPEGIKVDTKTHSVTVFQNYTLTVDGELFLNGSVLTLNKKDASKVEEDGRVVNNGTVSATDNVYSVVKLGTDAYTISGAYYSITEKTTTTYYVQPVAKAAARIAESDGLKLEIRSQDSENGIVIGDVSFTGTADAAASIVVMTKLTAASITLDLASISFSGEQAFTGVITNGTGTASIAGKAVNGFAVTSSTSKDVKTLAVSGQFKDSEKDDKFAVSGDVTFKTAGIDKLTVDGSAKIAKGSAATTVKTLVINGVVEVKNEAQLNVTGSVEVLGTLTAAAMTDSASAGSITAVNVFVGITEKDSTREYPVTTAASAVVSGKIAVSGYTIVADGSEVPESITSADTVKTTAYLVDGKAYVTAYAFTNTYIGIVKASVSDASWTGWYSGSKTTVDVSNKYIGSAGNETVSAIINYNIYNVVLKADAGIENVAIDGNLMDYDASTGAYKINGLRSGSHTVTYTLKNGYTGNATLSVNGEKQSGLSFTVSGAPAEYALQLSGVTASGYTPVAPVTPSEDKDDGLTITDYLLIVLVVLIVIMAVIVAMRLMRS